MGSRKVLISGPVEGKLSTLFKRVAAINDKSGPFDLLLCIGPFFADADDVEADDRDPDPELAAYLSGETPVPLPTYCIGAWGAGSSAAVRMLRDGANERLHFLGRSGVREVEGLLIAYLDGRYNGQTFRAAAEKEGASCRHYNQTDVSRLKSELQNAAGDIDFLLTNEWPEAVMQGVAPEQLPKGTSTAGSRVVREIAQAARPRYHLAGGKGVFFARAPYSNKDLGAGPLATRFIGLAEVGCASKQKWLHALGVVPAAKMDAVQLVTMPEGCTPSPYDQLEAQRLKRSADAGEEEEYGQQDWRWQTKRGNKKPPKKFKQDAPDSAIRNRDVVIDNRKSVLVRNIAFTAEDADLAIFFTGAGKVVDIRRGRNTEGRPNGFGYIQFDSEEAVERALVLGGTDLMGRPLEVKSATQAAEEGGRRGQAVDTCWFCLSNEGADVDLVVSVGEECYLAMDKGAIHDTHCLLLPIEHFPSSMGLSRTTWAEAERYLSALRSAFAAQGREVVAFERHVTLKRIGGNHCHINVVGVPRAAAGKAREAFQSHARASGFELQYVAPATGEALRSRLRELVGDGEYFAALLPDGGWLVRPILRGERHNLNFGREVLAQLLGTPDRADWKNCVVSVEQEQQRAGRLKELFKPFDLMQQ